ncbi:uncharacterized protein EI97DRAFT_97215 [Westerdykella ornata]|uniref:SNF2 family helicase/ATPase-like protein n=1 Tax=Westerdykella ornata TaxID=318751 RepID=A0A6A6JHI5_WESOR|nr:uncharacterized protein EI97DRAFT_97215 [Westerdykella ornata]KAF2274709.1 hypothetical protein EI97DRAFT_97215 [Westerdykella ornata]
MPSVPPNKHQAPTSTKGRYEPCMSSSPRKHRGPPRGIDTFSSPQKPSFGASDRTVKTQLSPTQSKLSPINGRLDYSGQDISIDDLGNPDSLFEESPGVFRPSPQSVPPIYHNIDRANRRNMVREREAAPLPQRTTAVPSKLPQERANTNPEFGKASPLRNPLKKDAQNDQYSHLFNVPKAGQSRPEHHRVPTNELRKPPPPPFGLNGQAQSRQEQYRAPTDELRRPPSHLNVNSHGLAGQGQHRSVPHAFKPDFSSIGPRPGTASSTESDLLEIPASQFQRKPYHGVPLPRPREAKLSSIPPAPRPLYSSMGHSDGFKPLNPGSIPLNPHGSRQTVIIADPLLKRREMEDDEDNFDPDAAIRAEGQQFGAPDPLAYVDSAKAQENIKALLEGAFEGDDERIPRTRGRKHKKQQQAEKDAASIADKLASLKVDDAGKASDEDEGEDEDAEDDGTVEGLKVRLLPHQVDGVAWMIEKETGAHMKKMPPKGGILADDMGLGKTIQSIALILSNPRPEKDVELENKKNKILPTVRKGTLIVAPLALIKQWESEINDKVLKSHSLKVLVHHGPNRTKSIEKLKSYDVVITTYQVLSSEHASCGEGPDGLKKGCFGVHWYRVILDEAHTIKNRNAKMTKACYDIRAHYRWCLTGTPMQNNLDELQSLIKFLQIKPYCDLSSWKDSISGPMKNGRGNLAMRRLQIFLKAFMKRRTKDVLKKDGALNFGGKDKETEDKGGFRIVARNVENVIGNFTAQERLFYNRLANRAESRLAEMMGGEKTDYIGALVLLLRLRQACNHPNLTKSNVKDDKDALTTGSKSSSLSGTQTPRKSKDTDADDLADLLGGLSVATKRCDICQKMLTKDTTSTDGIRCLECENDLNLSQKKPRRHKKHRKDKHKHRRSHKQAEDEEKKFAPSKSSRQRRVIVDSDDEDGEEGEWIVPEDQRDVPDLGKAGGTDDEDAEGGGDTLGSVDSDSFATEDSASKAELDSFIVHDTHSENEGPVVRKKETKKKVIDLKSDDESQSEASDDESSGTELGESETEEESEVEYNESELTPSTKIRQLLAILEKETPEHKVIVFSQFTSMLDLIEPFLRRGRYNYTRYDGSMRNDLREASLHKLRNDKRTRVLLCSLKCGSLGLNLTAASRVVIMEPFWNPFVEEQAIDRVHRLNQTVDVTVYRLSIHDSVEERILELQEAKRKLAAAALEGGKAMGKLSMKDMLALFKRDAEYDNRHVDDGSDDALFARMRVLDSPVKSAMSMLERSESTDRKRRKAGSLGLKRVEDSVWGRR